eukprot:m.136490 g.136490  ORF g.136490 m.136490 type:complete len:258 (+) comp10700_c0_seq1:176-949(+)
MTTPLLVMARRLCLPPYIRLAACSALAIRPQMQHPLVISLENVALHSFGQNNSQHHTCHTVESCATTMMTLPTTLFCNQRNPSILPSQHTNDVVKSVYRRHGHGDGQSMEEKRRKKTKYHQNNNKLVLHMLREELPNVLKSCPTESLALCTKDVAVKDKVHNINFTGRESLRISLNMLSGAGKYLTTTATINVMWVDLTADNEIEARWRVVTKQKIGPEIDLDGYTFFHLNEEGLISGISIDKVAPRRDTTFSACPS